jgi:hypothetical protein
MKNEITRPTWATVVGIMGIIIGCFGLLGGAQFMMMPQMMDMQQEMWSGMQSSIEAQSATNSQALPPAEMFSMMEKMWNTPDWFDTYCLFAGIVALFVSGFYMFASIRLLQTKHNAINLFYWAVGLTIGFAIVKAVVAMAAMSYMGMSMMMGGLFGIVIHIVLLIVVITGKKEAFSLTRS